MLLSFYDSVSGKFDFQTEALHINTYKYVNQILAETTWLNF